MIFRYVFPNSSILHVKLSDFLISRPVSSGRSMIWPCSITVLSIILLLTITMSLEFAFVWLLWVRSLHWTLRVCLAVMILICRSIFA